MTRKTAPQTYKVPSRINAPHFIIGVDIADRTFVATILADGQRTATSTAFEQSIKGFDLFIAWMQSHHVTRRSSIVAMETTGVYSQQLCLHLVRTRFRVTVIDAASIARHRSPSRPKSDPADSCAIAEYLYRYPDKVQPWQPKAPALQELSTLLSLREIYIRNRTALKNHRHAMLRAATVHEGARLSITAQIDGATLAIKQLDLQIKQVIQADPVLKQKAELLCTIPGLSLLFAANFLLITEGLEIPLDPKTIANYLGICPHEYSSGSSVRRRSRSSRLGPPRARKLLNLGSRSVCTHVPAFQEYYQRKLRQGKAKMLILNNIANQLVRIACAVLKSQMPYLKDYRSAKPSRS
jgi:transposase